MMSAFGAGSGMGRMSNADEILQQTMGRTSDLHARTRATLAGAQQGASAFNSGIADLANRFASRQAPAAAPPAPPSPPEGPQGAFGPMAGPSQGMNVPPAQEGAFGGPVGGQAMQTAPAGQTGGTERDQWATEVNNILSGNGVPAGLAKVATDQLRDPARAQATLQKLQAGELTPEMAEMFGPGVSSMLQTKLGKGLVKGASAFGAFG